MPERLRSFIAITLPDTVRAHLQAWQRTLEARLPSGALRWTHPDSAHLTLLFLGDITLAEVEVAHHAMRRAVHGETPLALEPSGLGCFPGFRKPRVVWLGVRGELCALSRVQARLQEALMVLTPGDKDKRFTPHLSLARVKRSSAALSRGLREAAPGPPAAPPRWTVRELVLMKSELHPEGARYKALRRAPLGGH